MSTSGRRPSKRACDGCKVRKIKCSGVSPCPACVAASVSCTFARQPLARGPRTLRAKTVRQIAEAQRARLLSDAEDDAPSSSEGQPLAPASSSAGSTTAAAATAPERSPLDRAAASPAVPPLGSPPGRPSAQHRSTPTHSLVLRLCVYRLRLFPVWPIIAVEEIMASLHRDPDDLEAYALANAVGAATVAQLKLERSADHDAATAASMEAECQRARRLLYEREEEPVLHLDRLRQSFFLHVYHENQCPGGSRSLLYLREAITTAQIMGLHKQSSYASLPPREQHMRQRILWLLFITERGVAMLHKLPVVLKCNVRSLNLDEAEDEAQVLPAFKKLVGLFWMFDQSGAFDILQSSDDVQLVPPDGGGGGGFELLQRQLRDVSMESGKSTDVQAADLCVTRQWMQAALWRASMARGQTADASRQATSLSHPIQIAREFLETISRLPASAVEAHGAAMEYKIYEIARAVADAVANGILLPRTSASSDGPGDILHQLQRKLASCRGGNKTLLSLLRARIAEVQGGAAAATDARPVCETGPADREVFPRPQPQPQQVHGLSDTDETGPPHSRLRHAGQSMTRSWQSRSAQQAQQEQPALERTSFESQAARPMQQQQQQQQQGTIWDQGVPEDLALSTHDLFNQLQTFDGSFNDAESAGAMDLILANTGLWDSVGGWDFPTGGAQNGALY
ncbi:hypothetical protein VTK73DRAFT_9429 [Phialemonium thermophilum]|uniref:Zn(2)-C6 fungal-type domain-containing protein n=1 Tax=Phialemonium thermophilum TaxID=223376 RepID=A0ABR3W2C0_9PEZI